MGFRIEPSIIDWDIEEKSLYTEEKRKTIEELREKLDTINYRLDSLRLQLQVDFDTSDEEQAKLRVEKKYLEDEKVSIEEKIKDYLEEVTDEFESADSFVGSLDEETEEIEELFSAENIGNAIVPNIDTITKEEARNCDNSLLESDASAQEINNEFRERAENMVSRLEDLFR